MTIGNPPRSTYITVEAKGVQGGMKNVKEMRKYKIRKKRN